MELSDTPKIQAFNIDCMEFMKDKPDNYYDLAIVDPPYGIERFKQCSEKDLLTKSVHAKRFQKMEGVNDEKPTREYWTELFRVSQNQIVWGANNFELPTSEYFLCWNKEQAMPNFATLEYAWVSMGLKKPAKLFTYSIHKHNQTEKVHPTQKPVALYRWLLTNYAKPNDKILDTHGGSCSSAIACHMEGFDLDICELDEDYFNDAVKRFRLNTIQEKLF